MSDRFPTSTSTLIGGGFLDRRQACNEFILPDLRPAAHMLDMYKDAVFN